MDKEVLKAPAVIVECKGLLVCAAPSEKLEKKAPADKLEKLDLPGHQESHLSMNKHIITYY